MVWAIVADHFALPARRVVAGRRMDGIPEEAVPRPLGLPGR